MALGDRPRGASLSRARLHFHPPTRCANSQPTIGTFLITHKHKIKNTRCDRTSIEYMTALQTPRLPPSLWIFFDRRLKYILRLRVSERTESISEEQKPSSGGHTDRTPGRALPQIQHRHKREVIHCLAARIRAGARIPHAAQS